jgi:uncharacterized membrane protein (UPF0127 family)
MNALPSSLKGILFSLLFWLCWGFSLNSCNSLPPVVQFQNQNLRLMSCHTPETRKKWLQGKDATLDGLCILDFAYTSKHSFHMFKVYLELTAYGVDENGEIHCIFEPASYQQEEITELPLYQSPRPIRYFYFLPRSLANRLKLQKGNRIERFPQESAYSYQAHLPGKTLYIELAKDPEERARGLMFRRDLGSHEGMLFLFPTPSFHSFWMKNCKIPLDLAYIDEKNILQEIHEMEIPDKGISEDQYPRYPSKTKGDKVLEVPKGWFRKNGIQVGMKILFDPPLN